MYLIVYAAMFDAFAKIDGGGVGRGAGDDKRIEMNEWLSAYKKLEDYGFKALENMSSNSKEQAKEIFNTKIDDNGGGIVLLDEWCEFIKGAEVEANTEVGKLLNADESGGVGTNYKLAGPAQVLGKGVKGKPGAAKSAASSPQKKSAEKTTPAPKAAPGTPNTFGLAVGKGKKTGASQEFFDFQSVFEPMCPENAAGEALREEGWKTADMNGNGLCE